MITRDKKEERALGDVWSRPEPTFVEPEAEPEARPSLVAGVPGGTIEPKAASDLFSHYADDLGDGLQTKARARSQALPATAAPKAAGPARLAALAATIEEHLARAHELLAPNQAKPAPLAALDHAIEQLSTSLGELQSSAEQLPSGHPALRSAFALSGRASVTLEQLERRRTSSVLADILPSGSEPSPCEQDPPAGVCFLPNRTDTKSRFRERILSAQDAYHAALQNKRIEVLLAKAPETSMLAEVLLNVLGTMTGGLLNGALSKALNNLNARAAWGGLIRASNMEHAIKAQSAVFKTIVSESISMGKKKVKSAFSHLPPQAQLKEAFLSTLQNQINPTLHSISQKVANRSDDLVLVLAYEVFNPDVFTVDYCSALIDEKLAAFECQRLDQIGPLKVGPVSNAGTREVVKLHAYGKHRLAVVQFNESKPMGRSYGDVWHTPSGQTFLNWVDNEFAAFATTTQEARNGEMKTIDVTGEHRLGDEVTQWAQKSRGGGS